MKKIITFILAIAVPCILSATVFAAENTAAAQRGKRENTIIKEPYRMPLPNPYSERFFKVETSDGQIISAGLRYPKTKKKSYPTVILLHSIGKTSKGWLPEQIRLTNEGYAVLTLDFRGHGKSVFDKAFHQKSWITYKHAQFEKFPSDVIAVIEKVQKETKKADFNNYAIIGSDIGANTAVLTAKELKNKPKALILISPQMTFKGLYIPVAMTEIGNTPILAITSKTNLRFLEEQQNLAKFAQSTYDIYNTEVGGADMTIIMQYPETIDIMTDWLKQYLK